MLTPKSIELRSLLVVVVLKALFPTTTKEKTILDTKQRSTNGYVYMEINSFSDYAIKRNAESMSTDSSLRKRKLTGGKKRAYRSKKLYEAGGYAAETILGEPKRKRARGMGGNKKIKVLTAKYASVTDQKTGQTQKTEILRVVRNGANVDFNRRGVITKGAEIETALGHAKVTSRPGNDGIINAVLIAGKEKQ